MERMITENLGLSGLDLANKPVIDTIQKCLTLYEPDTDIIMINALTICRNVCCALYSADSRKEIFDKNQVHDVVDQVQHTLNDLINQINYCYSCTVSPVPRQIIVYAFDYEKMIPKEFYRVPTDHFTQVIEHILKTKMTRGCTKHNDIVWEYYPDTTQSSYSNLVEMIRPIQNQHNVLMVSHHPIDYHLATSTNKWRLICSFTGDIKSPDDLGKAVFGSYEIPFTKATHVALGDRVDMKQSIKRGYKKQLVEFAQKEMWQLLSNEQLEERLKQLQIIAPYNI